MQPAGGDERRAWLEGVGEEYRRGEEEATKAPEANLGSRYKNMEHHPKKKGE